MKVFGQLVAYHLQLHKQIEGSHHVLQCSHYVILGAGNRQGESSKEGGGAEPRSCVKDRSLSSVHVEPGKGHCRNWVCMVRRELSVAKR